MTLSLCPSCRRHVKRDETACPFCDATLDGASRPPFSPVWFRRTLGAAAAAAAVATLGSKCDEPQDGPPDPIINVIPEPAAAPEYGAPPLEPDPLPTPVPPYGVAPIPPPDDDDDAKKAAPDDDKAQESAPVPAYGAPPPKQDAPAPSGPSKK